MTTIRLATEADLPAILDISNWAAMNTAANFAVEPETLESWQESWWETHEGFPWLVAVADDHLESDDSPPPSRGRAREGVDTADREAVAGSTETKQSTLPLAPSLEGRGERILGFAKASPWKSRCAYLWSAEVTVYVHPDHHGKGLGKALYGRLIPMLEAQGFHTIVGGITQPNEASVRLHEAFGLTQVALYPGIGWKFGRWHDVGYWQRILGHPDAAPKPLRPVAEVAPAILG